MLHQFKRIAEGLRLEGTLGGPQLSFLLRQVQRWVPLGLVDLQGWRLHRLCRQPAPSPS